MATTFAKTSKAGLLDDCGEEETGGQAKSGVVQKRRLTMYRVPGSRRTGDVVTMSILLGALLTSSLTTCVIKTISDAGQQNCTALSEDSKASDATPSPTHTPDADRSRSRIPSPTPTPLSTPAATMTTDTTESTPILKQNGGVGRGGNNNNGKGGNNNNGGGGRGHTGGNDGGRTYELPEYVLTNAVSVFNILVYGNFVVCLAIGGIYGRRKTLTAARKLTRTQWAALSIGSLLYSALCQCFVYLALQETTALNVTVLTRLEPIMIMGLARLVLKETVPRHNFVAALVSFAGIATCFLWDPMFNGTALQFGTGETCAVAAAVCISFSSIISKTMLKTVPLGLFMTYRTFLGCFLYTVIGMAINGESNLANPFLLCSDAWYWIMVYASLSLLAVLMWFAGVKRASAQLISLALSFGFILSLLVTYLVLGEIPMTSQWVGGSLIMVSLAIAQVGQHRTWAEEKEGKAATSDAEDWVVGRDSLMADDLSMSVPVVQVQRSRSISMAHDPSGSVAPLHGRVRAVSASFGEALSGGGHKLRTGTLATIGAFYRELYAALDETLGEAHGDPIGGGSTIRH